MSRPQRPGTILKTVHRRLDPTVMSDDETMAEVRLDMLAELNDFADRCGYTRHETREHTTHDGVTLTGLMSPRTDGQWPEIHEAIRQDAMDRLLLKNPPDPF